LTIWGALRRVGLASIALFAAIVSISRPGVDSARKPLAENSDLVIRTIVLTLTGVLVLTLGAGLSFMFSGVYPIAADRPHFAPVRWLLETGRTRSVEFHSRGLRAPNLNDRSLVSNGFSLYRKNCQPCHAAPGVAADQMGLGINPKTPQLVTTGTHWSDAAIYWITSHGLKMSGMPAFAPRLSDTDRWGIVAFLRRLSRLSPLEYQQLTAAADQGLEPTDWGTDDEQGFERLRNGNPETGKQLLRQYGCITCHTVPSIGHGQVGPPLTAFAERQYIAGSIVNVPTNTINWIMEPAKYKTNTAMPALNVKPREAVDIVAYLYTLGSPRRINTLQRTSAHH
jgi:mono/diheme cytochrome c family protein